MHQLVPIWEQLNPDFLGMKEWRSGNGVCLVGRKKLKEKENKKRRGNFVIQNSRYFFNCVNYFFVFLGVVFIWVIWFLVFVGGSCSWLISLPEERERERDRQKRTERERSNWTVWIVNARIEGVGCYGSFVRIYNFFIFLVVFVSIFLYFCYRY